MPSANRSRSEVSISRDRTAASSAWSRAAVPVSSAPARCSKTSVLSASPVARARVHRATASCDRVPRRTATAVPSTAARTASDTLRVRCAGCSWLLPRADAAAAMVSASAQRRARDGPRLSRSAVCDQTLCRCQAHSTDDTWSPMPPAWQPVGLPGSAGRLLPGSDGASLRGSDVRGALDERAGPPSGGAMSYRERVTAPGPKKLLALDGGGIRGVITLEVLSRMEELLAAEHGRGDDFVLADYFDYIAGTSTGAVIAAGLAKGLRVSRLLDLYTRRGAEMFDKAWLLRRYRYFYGSDRIKRLLQEVLGTDTTLGSEDVRTLLMMVLRNATTDSPWPLSNNPLAPFNQPDRADNNLALPLWQLVRASTAAPVYFPPEVVTVGEHVLVFVDGGLTMYNNPAFQLFLMATLDAYRLGWTATETDLLLVSVGTGMRTKADDHLQPGDMNLLFNASSVPAALMYAALNEQDLLCRVFGRCRHGAAIDREVGDLRTGPGVLDQRLFSYVRYNVELSRAGLDALGLGGVRPEDVQKLDSVAHIPDLVRVGEAAAG